MSLPSIRPLLVLLLATLSLSTWAGSEPLRVVTTIKPIHSILSSLMDGTRAPELLVTGSQSPYSYQLSSRQRSSIQRADVVVWVGPELERFMTAPIQELGPNTTLFTLLDNHEIKVLPSRWDEERRDPFFWMDSRNVIILADELARGLMRIDPERSALYEKNRHRLLNRLADLDRRLEYGYRGLRSGIGMAYYDTLQYFEQAYALKIRGVVAESPATPITGQSLLENHARLRGGDYSCLLTEQQMDGDEYALLTMGTTLNIGELDSFGSGIESGPDHYFILMEQNTSTIKHCLRYEQSSSTGDTIGEQQQHTLLDAPPPARIGGRFMLRDHNGKLFTDQDMVGKYQLIYFGYTFCPDVCPTSLVTISSAMAQLDTLAEEITPYFITVDPARDTIEVLSTYVGYFHPRLIGLTGSQEMVDRVARLYNVKYQKVIDESRPADQYIMDHSSGVYLMAPDGAFITKLAHGISADAMAARIREILPK